MEDLRHGRQSGKILTESSGPNRRNKKAFEEKAYKRWLEPFFMCAKRGPDGHAKVKGKCGNSIEIFLEFENDRVANASFQTDGCGPGAVCGFFAIGMALGKIPMNC